MDTTQRILLSVGLSTEELDKKLLSSQDKVAKLTAERKKLQTELDKKIETGAIEKGSKAYDEMKTAINKVGVELKFQQSVMREVEKQQLNALKVTNSQEGSYTQLAVSYGLIKQRLNEMSLAERQSTEEGKKLEAESLAIYEQMKLLQEATGKHVLSVGDYTKVIKPLVEALEQENVTLVNQNKTLEVQRGNIGFLKDVYGSQEEGIKAINAQLELNNQKYQQNNDMIHSVTNSIGFMSGQNKEAGNSINEVDGEIGQLTNKLASLKEQLANPNSLSKEQFRQLNDEVKKTQLEIDQAAGKVDEFGNKEPKNLTKKAYEDAAEAAAGLTSAITLTTLAFGKNENLQELQAKATLAVAVAQNVQNIAKATGAIIDTAAVVRTKALTAAQLIYGQVVGKSTGAMKVFKLALAGTGIGAIVVLLTELITNWDGVNKIINRGINYIRDFAAEVSGGNKIIQGLVEVLLLVVSPLVTIIRLINDFNGTISQFQSGINGAYDSVINLTDGIPILNDMLKLSQILFNFAADGIKSLDGSAKKFKVNLETLTKVYENHNQEIEKNKKNIDDQIRLAQAQGASEEKVAELTRKSLQAQVKARELSYNKAVEIANKLIKQNSKLNDEQQKLFDRAQEDYQNSQVELSIFDAEQLQARREKWKQAAEERKQVLADLIKAQMDYELQLKNLQVQAIKDDEQREQAALKLQLETELAAIDENLKNLKGKEEDKAKVIEAANKVKNALLEKFGTESLAITDKYDKIEQEAYKNTFAFKAATIADQLKLDLEYAEATIKDTEKLEQEKLRIKIKSLQEQLALSRAFFEEDGRFTEQELAALGQIQSAIDQASATLTELENKPKVIDGLGMTQEDLDNINFAAEQITTILNTISSVVNADAERRKREIDDVYKREVAAIENSTLSQEEKEEKIQALNKKTALEKYNIEEEQFKVNQAFQIINTTIAGALAAVQALAQLGPIAGGIAAGVIAGVTAAQIGIIASQKGPEKPQFFDGGFTEAGNPREKSRYSNSKYDLHKGEFVTANRVLKRPEAWPHVAALAAMHTNTPGSLGLGGFADGGFTARSLNEGVLSNIEFQRTISTEIGKQLRGLKVYTSLDDISSGLNKQASRSTNSRLV
jgi:hypothetical protein